MSAAHRLRFTLATIIVVAGACGIARDSDVRSAASLPNSFVVRNVRLLDGRRVVEHADVVIRDGRMSEIDPPAQGEESTIIEGTGSTLILPTPFASGAPADFVLIEGSRALSDQRGGGTVHVYERGAEVRRIAQEAGDVEGTLQPLVLRMLRRIVSLQIRHWISGGAS